VKAGGHIKSQAARPHLSHQPSRQDEPGLDQARDLLTIEMQFRLAVARIPQSRELLAQYGDLISRSPVSPQGILGVCRFRQ